MKGTARGREKKGAHKANMAVSSICEVGRSHDPAHPVCQSCKRNGVLVCSGQLQAKANKYGAKKVLVDGVLYDSKKEYGRWLQLQMMERAGMISDLKRQVVFELQPATILDNRKKPPIRYKADAVYTENGKQVVEDTKSEATRKLPTYRLKRHLMKTALGIEIREF